VRIAALLTLLLSCAPVQAYAQAQNEPFFLIRIVREGPAPERDFNPASIYRESNAAVDVLAMQAISGPSQTWMLESHRSFGSIEAVDKLISRSQTIDATRWIGLYRPGLSYRPEEAVKLMRTARYFQVSIYRIRPGAEFDFAELIRLRKASFDSINLDRPELGYSIISGASTGVFVFLAPLPSLQTLDNGFARMPVYAEGAGKTGRQIAAEAEATREHLFFRVEPSRSYVSDGFAAADPTFWKSN